MRLRDGSGDLRLFRGESDAVLVFDKLRDFLMNRIRMKTPIRTKRAKRTKKPKHRVVTLAFDFQMEVNARQNERVWMQGGAYWRLRNALVANRIDNRIANKLLNQQGATDIHYLS